MCKPTVPNPQTGHYFILLITFVLVTFSLGGFIYVCIRNPVFLLALELINSNFIHYAIVVFAGCLRTFLKLTAKLNYVE